jgi:hypothetical protein
MLENPFSRNQFPRVGGKAFVALTAAVLAVYGEISVFNGLLHDADGNQDTSNYQENWQDPAIVVLESPVPAPNPTPTDIPSEFFTQAFRH